MNKEIKKTEEVNNSGKVYDCIWKFQCKFYLQNCKCYHYESIAEGNEEEFHRCEDYK